MSKVVVITGGSKGIGAATAIAFAKVGYDVVINYNHDVRAANDVAQQITALRQQAVVVKANIFTEAGVAELFVEAKKHFGVIDVMINNAGLPDEPAFGEYDQQSALNSVSANFVAAVLCTQAVVPLMKKGGSILFTSSILGLNYGGNPAVPLYSAAKAAVINFAQTMAEKLAPDIRCNVVAPGSTRTPQWDGAKAEFIKNRLSTTLQNEWVEADEIAAAFVFLAETRHMNCETIVVDGGWRKKIVGQKIAKK